MGEPLMNGLEKESVDRIEKPQPPVEARERVAVDWTESEWFLTWQRLARKDTPAT